MEIKTAMNELFNNKMLSAPISAVVNSRPEKWISCEDHEKYLSITRDGKTYRFEDDHINHVYYGSVFFWYRENGIIKGRISCTSYGGYFCVGDIWTINKSSSRGFVGTRLSWTSCATLNETDDSETNVWSDIWSDGNYSD